MLLIKSVPWCKCTAMLLLKDFLQIISLRFKDPKNSEVSKTVGVLLHFCFERGNWFINTLCKHGICATLCMYKASYCFEKCILKMSTQNASYFEMLNGFIRNSGRHRYQSWKMLSGFLVQFCTSSLLGVIYYFIPFSERQRELLL